MQITYIQVHSALEARALFGYTQVFVADVNLGVGSIVVDCSESVVYSSGGGVSVSEKSGSISAGEATPSNNGLEIWVGSGLKYHVLLLFVLNTSSKVWLQRFQSGFRSSTQQWF